MIDRGAMRWFVRGDIDGFFGLALDNLVQLLLIDALCRCVLGFRRRAALRPRAAGRRGLAAGRQSLLRVAGARLARAHRTRRRVRAALRHQHRVALRARLPGDAAGQAGARRPRAPPDPVAGRVAGGAGRLPRLGADRARGRLRRRARAPSARRARRCCRRWPASRSASSRSGFLFRAFARPIVGIDHARRSCC